MTNPPAPRDVDLDTWLDGIGFHPADTVAKQVGHQYAREMIANVGAVLHELLPAGRDKPIVFTLLEDVLVRANRALAVGGGPADQGDGYIEELKARVEGSPIGLPRDHRYEAEQRGEVTEPAQAVAGVPMPQATELYTFVNAVGDAIRLHKLDRYGSTALLITVQEARLGGITAEIEIVNDLDLREIQAALASARKKVWPQG